MNERMPQNSEVKEKALKMLTENGQEIDSIEKQIRLLRENTTESLQVNIEIGILEQRLKGLNRVKEILEGKLSS